MMRVTSTRLVINEGGMESKEKKGNCLIDLTQIQHVETVDLVTSEIIMRSGDRFFVEKPTFDEIVEMLQKL